jgi:subtilisin family serine protease
MRRRPSDAHRCAPACESVEPRVLLSTVGAEPPRPRHVPGEVLIQYRPDADAGAIAAARRLAGGRAIETLAAGGRGAGRLELVALPAGVGVEAAIQALASSPAVLFAEPNQVYTTQAVSNDPLYTNGSLWGMYGDATSPANAFGSQAGEAWAAGQTGSASVYVGIIDEGFMFGHADLAGNAWLNPFDPVNGRDDDGNGYVDDVRGWDFANNDASVFDGTSDDHGTHVAGTIGAVGGNGAGVAGVAWDVTLISGKFLGRNGGTTANAVRAVDYFTDLKTRHGLNIVATNNSWGGGGYSQALFDAIARANSAGILFVAAAGNGGIDGVGDDNDRTPSYPASYTNANVIAVASITSTGARSSFSNFGATSVDIGAPGSNIQSTLPGRNGSSTYGAYSGTSMATPHVTGAAALYAAARPGATAAQIKDAILTSATPTASLAGRVATGGRLNVAAMLAVPLTSASASTTAGTSATGSGAWPGASASPVSTGVSLDSVLAGSTGRRRRGALRFA